MNYKEKARGCLLGGAAGDALGFPVEFLLREQIINQYGPEGIGRYETEPDSPARISDDTQMILYTASGILSCESFEDRSTEAIISKLIHHIKNAYLEWYALQTSRPVSPVHEISSYPAMRELRSPGMTCMNALLALSDGKTVRNDSKGCGGIMRIAPAAIINHDYWHDSLEVACLGEQTARITHKNPLGFIPAALLAYLLDHIFEEEKRMTRESFIDIIEEECSLLPSFWDFEKKDLYGILYPSEVQQMKDLIYRAVALTESDLEDWEAISRIGEGWSAEETFAIAVYSCLAHFGDFEGTVKCAVNITGDSDSTGSVAGNIMGAIVGESGIPEHFKSNLELADLIRSTADQLCRY